MILLVIRTWSRSSPQELSSTWPSPSASRLCPSTHGLAEYIPQTVGFVVAAPLDALVSLDSQAAFGLCSRSSCVISRYDRSRAAYLSADDYFLEGEDDLWAPAPRTLSVAAVKVGEISPPSRIGGVSLMIVRLVVSSDGMSDHLAPSCPLPPPVRFRVG